MHSGAEYFKLLKPVSDGYLKGLKSHNESDMIYYSNECISITSRFLPIISSYKVSDKIRVLQNELILEMESHRSSQVNYLRSIQSEDKEEKLEFLKLSFKYLASANEHFKNVKKIEDQLKICFL